MPGLYCSHHTVDIDYPTGPDPMAELRNCTVIGRTQTASLVDRWMHIGVISRWKSAGQDRSAVVANRFAKLLEHRPVGIEKAEGMVEHPMLKCGVSGSSKRPPEREVAEETARGRDADNLLTNQTDGERNEALGLKDVGERTHGTRAQRSYRGQQDDVYALFLQPLRGSRA